MRWKRKARRFDVLNFVDKIRRHAAVAKGNFSSMFGEIEIPPLPAAISRLVTEIGKEEPDMQQLGQMVAATPEISMKILQTVNSALFFLPNPVNSVTHAVTLLGLKRIRPLILSFATAHSLPTPPGELFEQQVFWSDSLLKALIARAFADSHCPDDREDAFTAMLLADIALPVLLTSWSEYYQPVVRRWRGAGERLSRLERDSFQWDHAQAGAWILQDWGFPEELVCFVGLHNADGDTVREFELQESAALPVAVAAMAPGCLNPDPVRARAMLEAAAREFQLTETRLQEKVMEIRMGFGEICSLFDIIQGEGGATLDLLDRVLLEMVEEA
ncbi:MAG: HDOD domain-containing protein [Candidatus Sedimenticola sp. (ex Thyasira tokunagai)]